GLNGGRLCECHESVGKPRVEVRLRHVETELRLLCSKLDVRGAASRIRHSILRSDAPARKQILREREAEVVLILRSEAKAAERGERVSSKPAARRVFESSEPLRGRSSGVAEILIARCGWRRRLRGIDRGSPACARTLG